MDAPHPGALTLQHLAAQEFLGVPEVYGVLLWRTPGGHEVPVADGHPVPAALAGRLAVVGPSSSRWPRGCARRPCRSGRRQAGIDLSAVELPARLGRLVAKLHLVLATPSRGGHADRVRPPRTPRTCRTAAPGARAVLEAGGGDTTDADALDGLAERRRGRAAARVLVQRVHGDLHVGRVLRWTRGLSVVGFDAARRDVLTGATTLRPAAADVARGCSASLARVARGAPGVRRCRPDVPGAWYRRAREQVLAAYRSALAAEDAPDLLDERLLAAFEAAERAHVAGPPAPRTAGQPLTGQRPQPARAPGGRGRTGAAVSW